jgi:CRISPR-associated protein Cas6
VDAPENECALPLVVDVAFPILEGTVLEIDHGHALYGALKRACPGIQGRPGLGIHTVRGIPGLQGLLMLDFRSEVRLRLPEEDVPLLEGLSGSVLAVRDHAIRLGEPQRHRLSPFPSLWARTVTLHFPDMENGGARDQLVARFLQTYPQASVEILRPRTIRVHGRQILGFEMVVGDLDDRESLQLQFQGFGGRRALGCGLFLPHRRRSDR